ncbi:MAG: TlpA family protein disulfide reductase [Wenzhouxiangella sp.]|nr:TlpA family protein disulfide reductase [Wenzhouxiangella sp.]MCH8477076.1 TlpA family protein disulfide reductase [Wenzhouxiangella sp.]TVR94223.1 MAG: TlpA family protein disulfide reductase [Wenzhouxiangellaceae bacterium]
MANGYSRRSARILPLILALALSGLTLADYSEKSFETLDGGTAALGDYHGQIVVLNLWAVWCSPCLIEIPHLVALQDSLEAADATVIGLSIDSGSPGAISRFWERRLQITPNYPLWLGTADQARQYFGARTYPTTLIIDRDGEVRQTLIGLQTKADLEAAINALR